MTTRAWIAAISLSSALLGACSKGPGATAQQFVGDLAKGEIADAKKYCTPQTAQMLDIMVTTGALKLDPSAKIEVVEENTQGDLSEVKLRENDSRIESVKLIKQDGDWKVHMAK